MSVLDSQWVVVWFAVATILVTWVLLLPFNLRANQYAGCGLLPRKASYDGRGRLPLAILCPLRSVLFKAGNKLTRSYGEVDYIYGWKAYNEHNGFTNAQSLMNVFELLMQIRYLQIRKRPGHEGQALLVGYSVSLMSLAKTALYWLQEYYSG
jgi:hypothetical protein